MLGPDLKLVKNERSHKRVKVSLSGALCVPGSPIAMIRTDNISEGGVAVKHPSGLLPKRGDLVKLQLDGIVGSSSANADRPSANADQHFDVYSMKVVYANKSSIGLAFEGR